MCRIPTARVVLWVALLAGMVVPELAEAGKSSGPISSPVLAYINRSGDLEVSNADGAANSVIVPGYATRPTWRPTAPTNQGPYRIVYESPICVLNALDVGVPQSGLPQLVPGSVHKLSLGSASQGCAANFSSDGSQLVFGEGYVESGDSSIFLMDAGTGNVTGPIYTPAASGNVITWATFSPAGDQIAFVEEGPGPSYQTTIKVITKDTAGQWGNPSLVVAPANGSSWRFLEWSPLGDKLAFDDGAGSIYTARVSDGIPVRVTSGGTPTWSPDGASLFLSGTTGIVRVPASGGTAKSIVKGAHHPKFRRTL
jgi:WD40 repeat protein